MGYTHYWDNEETIPAGIWEAICGDARKLIEVHRKQLRDVNIDGDEIFFNGENVETFQLLRPRVDWQWCKTRGRQPYDAVVCAILATAAERHPALNVSSDANWTDDEKLWDFATAWASEVLGRT